MKKITFLIILSLTFLSCSFDYGFISGESDRELVNDPEIRKGILDNGLGYVIRRNKNPEKKAEFRLGINVGSLQEKDSERGAAHFVEHMAFNGIKNFEKNKIIEFFEKNGMGFGTDLNAYTGYTETVYRFSLPTDKEEVMDKAFLILKDWASGIMFESREVDKEKSIILEELRARKSQEKRTRDRIMPLVYGPLYSERMPIGLKKIIMAISSDQLRAFYKNWYRPGLMSIVIVGDIDPEETESRIREVFSDLQDNEDLPELKNFKIPEYKKFQYIRVEDHELTKSTIKIYQHTKTNRLLKEKDLRNNLIEELYTVILKNRFLDKKASEQAYHQIYLYNWLLAPGSGVLNIQAEVKNNRYRECFKNIFRETERLKRYGVNKAELKKAKDILFENSRSYCTEEETRKSSDYADRYIRNMLDKDIIISAESYRELSLKYLPSVGTDDINRFHSRINLPDRVIVSMGNKSSSEYFPDNEGLEKILEDIKKDKIEPYIYTVPESFFFKEKIARGKISEKKYDRNLDITTLRLSNGATVILKPTEYEKDLITFLAYSPGGLSLLDPEFIPLKLLADPVTRNSGIGPYTKQELTKRLMGKKVDSGIYLDTYEEGIKGSFSPDYTELFLQTIHLRITRPRFQEKAFNAQKTKFARQTENSQKTAYWKFRKMIRKTLYADNIYARPVTKEDIIRLEHDSSRKSLMERFQNRGDFTFQFVGDFKVRDILPMIEQYLGSLPEGKVRNKARNLDLKPLPGRHFFSINENIEDKSSIIVILNHEFKFSQKRSYEFSFLQTILDMEINRELRERQGLIYSGYPFFRFFSAQPSPYSQILFHFTCAPENADRVISGLKKILKQLREQKISEEKIQTIKNIVRTKAEKDRRDNWEWSSALHNLVTLNQDIDTLSEYENYIQELTPVSLKKYSEKYLNEKNMLTGILNPKNRSGTETGAESCQDSKRL